MNLRTTSNLLLALSAAHPSCRPHLQRYLSAAVRLPTDWVAVADLVQTFGPGADGLDPAPGLEPAAAGSLPAALRRAMVAKFPDFDEYQLAKHNKAPKKRVSCLLYITFAFVYSTHRKYVLRAIG